MGGEIEVGPSFEICDYCGSICANTVKCFICMYDLCEQDIVTVDVEEEEYFNNTTDLYYCKSCVARYYQELSAMEYSIYR